VYDHHKVTSNMVIVHLFNDALSNTRVYTIGSNNWIVVKNELEWMWKETHYELHCTSEPIPMELITCCKYILNLVEIVFGLNKMSGIFGGYLWNPG
jgi:hypothetical protein